MFDLRKGFYFQSDGNNGGGQPPTPPTPPTPPPAEPDRFPTSWDEVFKHPRFKELNDRAKAATDELARIKAAEKEAADKALAEQNKWQELYQGSQKDLAAERLTTLRIKTASSKGLPMELVERLHGETEEEISKDADSLLALMKPVEPGSKGVPPSRRSQAASAIDFATETDPAKIRAAVRAGQTQ